MDKPKIFFNDIIIKNLSENGRSCEVCDQHMHKHDWVVLDYNGFAVWCSIEHEVQLLARKSC